MSPTLEQTLTSPIPCALLLTFVLHPELACFLKISQQCRMLVIVSIRDSKAF